MNHIVCGRFTLDVEDNWFRLTWNDVKQGKQIVIDGNIHDVEQALAHRLEEGQG